MRLLRAERRKVMLPLPGGEVLIGLLDVRFSVNGTEVTVSLALPAEWDTWDRPTKIAWAKQEVASRTAENRYRSADELVFPDPSVQDKAISDFQDLPGWSTWDAQQVEGYVRANAKDVDSMVDILVRMGQALVHMRDAVIER
jgi:hypothetical protein